MRDREKERDIYYLFAENVIGDDKPTFDLGVVTIRTERKQRQKEEIVYLQNHSPSTMILN